MINAALFSSSTDEWATPQWLFNSLNKEFGFTLDPCALPSNAKCEKYFTPQDNGLLQDWGGGDCVLQSSLWQSHRLLGTQV